ncbi:hypothetical protein [Chryseobacterium sp. SL1]|uniref:hypothetical protein n=1 Tax=Chryseobacterium sp. SL1 TaxID=2995159 RepID=UPI001A438F1F|nr:hypothetical protein [Chryseobacterium sp. SL1]MBL7879847.1 hypothetical protein [Chryseobacterium gambrini]MCY1663352.1 hypothetical protein [Chryseobacterium sp. SL1]
MSKPDVADFHKDLQILIGKRISEIRMKNNQTQQDLEFLTGIDSAEVSSHSLKLDIADLQSVI